MAKQIRFYVSDSDFEHGGILLDNGDVICGCCGGLIEDGDYVILEEYENWINLDEEIIGN